MLTRLLTLGLLLIPMALAADDDSELFQEKEQPKSANTGVPNANTFKDDDDIDIPAYTATPPPEKDERNLANIGAVGQTTKMPIEVSGLSALADNYEAKIAYVDTNSVVIDLPVLYAQNRDSFDGIAFWLVAEVYADGKKVGESRVFINSDAIAVKGPSIQFFRLFAPVAATSGALEVRVGKASSSAAKPTALFSKTLNYKL